VRPGWEGRPLVAVTNGLGGALAVVVIAWLLYLAVRVAEHVSAWPF
jgi:hypothetical protein